MSYDLVIRNGEIVDGSGAPSRRGDIGISNGVIAEIGAIGGRGRREIDAEGQVVSPGFIDGHTHLDAQVNWDPLGTCACWHGTTSVVMGNCGFTLAPSRANARELVLRNLERAEDIPAEALASGIVWRWETFPEYLEALEALPKGINYAVSIGHSALRTWAMGERAFTEQASEDDMTLMERQVADALKAGAIGFTTSRTGNHETSDNRPVASRVASWDEVRRLVGVLAESGAGIFGISPDHAWGSPDPEIRGEYFGRLTQLAMKVPVVLPVFSGLMPMAGIHAQLALLDSVAASGGTMFAVVHPRGITIVLSFLGQLPFDKLPQWQALRAKPVEDQKRLLRDPALRQRLVHEAHHGRYGTAIGSEARKPDWNEIFIFDRPFPPYPTVTSEAARRGVDPVEAMIDLALESDFRQNFLQYNGKVPSFDDLLTIIRHPQTVTTFSDTGAHVGQVSDSSLPTYFLAFWARERKAFTLEDAVRMITAVPAQRWGLKGRGLLREGMIADINVFDFERLMPGLPSMVRDLPGGARRLVNKTEGIRATIVGGDVLMENGEHTGALPGRLLRG